MSVRVPMPARAITLAVVAASLVALTACGRSDGSDGSVTVGFSSPVGSQPGEQSQAKGFKAAAESLGWKTEVYDANLSPETQASHIETMLQKNDDAIVTWTLDPGSMQGTYANAADKKIPIIGVNSGEPQLTTQIWWEYFLCDAADAPFKRAAQAVAAARPGAKVIVMGGPPVPSIQNNAACFKKAAEDAGLTVLTQADNVQDNAAGSQALVADLLTKYPDVDMIWAYNDATALGASSAVTGAGKTVSDGTSDGVIIEGANGDADAIEAIRQGRLTGTWDPNQYATGVAAVKVIQDLKAGGSPTKVVIRSTYWDATNIDEYKTQDEQHFTLGNLPIVTE